ncbi:response regulator transcription factor [Chloroflexota bacterium]
MNRRNTILTREERDLLILAAVYLNGEQISNTEIAQQLGMSVSRVKTVIHQACVKLGAQNRIEAILLCMKRGEISLNEFYSFDELTERLGSLGPEVLRRIAHFVRQGRKYGYLPEEDEEIIRTDRRSDSLLTQTEREILILAGRGLTNKEIADRLYVSTGTVRTLLSRAYAKLGKRRRGDAVLLAVKQKEINALDIFSPNELVNILAPLGADSLEKMAQLVDQKLGREAVITRS